MRTLDFHRGLVTLLAAAVAGGLLWLAGAYVGTRHVGPFWASMGIVAGAGLVMALSQVLGGWTKFGLPRFSVGTFLLAFLPVLVVVGWVLIVNQPVGGWQHGNLASWSRNVGILDVIHDLRTFNAVLAFGFGLVFGYCFDTTGARREERVVERRRGVRAVPVDERANEPMDRRAADEPLTAEREAAHNAQPHTVTVGPRSDDATAGTHSAVGDGRRVEIREHD